jgi:hypothetical protein
MNRRVRVSSTAALRLTNYPPCTRTILARRTAPRRRGPTLLDADGNWITVFMPGRTHDAAAAGPGTASNAPDKTSHPAIGNCYMHCQPRPPSDNGLTRGQRPQATKVPVRISRTWKRSPARGTNGKAPAPQTPLRRRQLPCQPLDTISTVDEKSRLTGHDAVRRRVFASPPQFRRRA